MHTFDRVFFGSILTLASVQIVVSLAILAVL